MMLLFPTDVLRPQRVDEHFAGEAQAARALDWSIALVDHDALAGGADCAVAVAGVPADEVVIYRGWMLSSRAYGGLAAALAARGSRLHTDAGQYHRGHELPGWYAALSAFTPASAWTVGTGRGGFDTACAALGSGPAIVRDYSKSMKHYWHEATYIPDLADAAAAWTIAARMADLRGDDFTGGYVLRRYEPFTGAEVRTWWIGGVCRLVTAHPDTPNDPPPEDLDLTALQPAIAGLDLPFVTVDLARRTDGVWRVVELGDGQVSDRPANVAPEDLITILPRT
ncbi:ATP-grasp domain-containing protein [Micromonospora sp. NPDC049275]|uniref:ATP-grasp domain-containing protein n=1 Tax=Micromonospora sp. NPDC049275 TaxID=3364268 RepID=UPI003719612E